MVTNVSDYSSLPASSLPAQASLSQLIGQISDRDGARRAAVMSQLEGASSEQLERIIDDYVDSLKS